MLPFPGLTVMPTVVLNALLGLLPERFMRVRGPDRLAAVLPMFNEERGAAAALAALFSQDELPEEVAISINGGNDATAEVVREALTRHGFQLVSEGKAPGLDASLQRWHLPEGGPRVSVLDYSAPVSKAHSVNALIEANLIKAERVLVVDGDTVLEPGFVSAVKDSFYRLRRLGRRDQHGARYLLEDTALQSGAVLSLPGGGLQARFISLARSAEYAFAALLRRGQSRRLGRRSTFGRTRLFTVVGCGFVARRDCFPIPADTLTEDHDLTLGVQNRADTLAVSSAAALDLHGFRIVEGERRHELASWLEPYEPLSLTRTAAAIFVPEAQMFTEDPPHLAGYLRQVERWNGGAIQNVLKRFFLAPLRRDLKPNVSFTLLAAQFECLLGILLLLAVPLALAVQRQLPGVGLPLSGLVTWFAADLLLSWMLVVVGFGLVHGARPQHRSRRWWWAFWGATRGVVPLVLLRYLHALSYLAAATRVVPAFGRARREMARWRTQAGGSVGAEALATGVIWERPAGVAAMALRGRTAGVAATLLLLVVGAFGVAGHIASSYRPGYRTAWQLIYDSPRLHQEDHQGLPVWIAAPGVGQFDASRGGPGSGAGSEGTVGVSPFCEAGRGMGREPPSLGDSAGSYQRLSPWGLLMLARLAPLLAPLEEAASAYDLPPEQLLKVLLNESFLDPLAQGPTKDVGLAQMTSDALTLLRSISLRQNSPFYNDKLFASDFSLFDPLFSLCAGAAKLAWARSEPGGDDERLAYARYINPLDGVVGGRVSARHEPLVEKMQALGPLTGLLAATVAAYRADPLSVSKAERALLDVAAAVGSGESTVAQAYLQVSQLVREFKIDDRQFYTAVLDWLYNLRASADEL